MNKKNFFDLELWEANVEARSEYSYAGNWKKVIEVCNAYLRYYPEDTPTLNEIAEAHLKLNDFNSALKAAEKSYKADSKDPDTISLIARILKYMGKGIEEFKWMGKPKILTLTEAVELTLPILKKSGRKPILVDLWIKVCWGNDNESQDFTFEEFVEAMRKDKRFMVIGELGEERAKLSEYFWEKEKSKK